MPTTRRLRFGLGTALAFSIALHVALAPFVRAARASAVPERTAPPLTIDVTTPFPAPPTPPPPTPTPRPVLTPPPVRKPTVPVAHPRVAGLPRRQRAPHVRAAASGPATRGQVAVAKDGPADIGASPSAGASADLSGPEPAQPTATPTPKPVCDRPEVAARSVDVVEPEMPQLARERNATGEVAVRVDLGETGAVLNVAIERSADPSLDAAALDAARRSTYAPAISNCKAHGGSYLFRVEFDG